MKLLVKILSILIVIIAILEFALHSLDSFNVFEKKSAIITYLKSNDEDFIQGNNGVILNLPFTIKKINNTSGYIFNKKFEIENWITKYEKLGHIIIKKYNDYLHLYDKKTDSFYIISVKNEKILTKVKLLTYQNEIVNEDTEVVKVNFSSESDHKRYIENQLFNNHDLYLINCNYSFNFKNSSFYENYELDLEVDNNIVLEPKLTLKKFTLEIPDIKDFDKVYFLNSSHKCITFQFSYIYSRKVFKDLIWGIISKAFPRSAIKLINSFKDIRNRNIY